MGLELGIHAISGRREAWDRSGEIGNLWPLTLMLSSILSLPFVVAAWIGARFRRAASRSASA